MKLTTEQENRAIDKALRILESRMQYGERTIFDSPNVVKEYLSLQLALEEREIFSVLFLDNRHQLISFDKVFFGTIDGASVYPREIVKLALEHNSAAVIFAHNHPSGVSDPSEADKRITARLKDSLALIDVRVLDHIVIGKGNLTSFAECGLL